MAQPQQITNFAPTEAPITMVILMEFSRRFGGFFGYKAKEWSYSLLNALTAKDWVALKTFSMRTHVEVDFTQNKNEVGQAIASLFFPDFSEANLFDAIARNPRPASRREGQKIDSGSRDWFRHLQQAQSRSDSEDA